MAKQQEKVKQDIAKKEQTISESFTNFGDLFQNASELKEVIVYLKDNLKVHDETFQQKGEV